MDILSNFAESISDQIFDQKLTLEQFADKVGINVSEIYRYKRKERLPSTANLIKIANVCNCSIDALLGLAPYNENVNYRSDKTFCEVFRNILFQHNVTRYKLCQETKLAPSRVDDWYNGKRLPTVDNLIILKNYFNCSIDFLLGRE